ERLGFDGAQLHRGRDGQALERGEDRVELLGLAPHQWSDGEAAGQRRLEHALGLQAKEGLANRGAGNLQRPAERRLGQGLTGLVLTGADQADDARVHGGPQRLGARDRTLRGRLLRRHRLYGLSWRERLSTSARL